MKCDHCDNEAVVHLTQMVNGAMKEVHLCGEHAKVQGVDMAMPISITDILMGLNQQATVTPSPVELIPSCASCGMSRDEFRKNGRLGCPDCYKTFMAELTATVNAMHHSSQHVGKIPAGEGSQTRIKSRIARLQKDLDGAIAREDFERAATLRDEIKTCRNEKSSGDADDA